MNTYTVDGVTVYLAKKEQSRSFKRGSSATLVMWEMIIMMAVMATLIVLALYGQNLSSSMLNSIVGGSLVAAFTGFLLVICLHLHARMAARFLAYLAGIGSIIFIAWQTLSTVL